MTECPCKTCQCRTPTCHGICTRYKKWSVEQKKMAQQIKYKQREAGMGTPFNQTRGNLYYHGRKWRY